MLVFNETWYTVITIQEDDMKIIKRVKHRACFSAYNGDKFG